MKFSVAAAAVAALAAGVQAGSNETYVTEVVDVYVTYCPYATTLTHGSKTYTVTEATTLTITDCPCTISKPVYSASSVACATCSPVYPTTYPNSTIATGVKSTGGVYSTTTGSTPIATGGAAQAVGLSGAALAGVVGVAALFL
ncbi:hypothetical protein BX600DRAFT_434132 [Xylariales sp. PMI_506]|nr:hypothetical protein BX600DRAFT_434132 [Xylariales sp. PMI_506]